MRKVIKFLIIFSFFSTISLFAEKKIGVAYFSKSGMAERVIKGFEEQIKSLIPDVNIEYKRELKDEAELSTVIAEFENTKDAIIALRSSGAKYLSKITPKKPSFIGASNNPVEIGVIKNMEAPEGMVTGVTYFLPKKEQFEIFQTILPSMESILLVVQEGHPATAIDIEETKELSAELAINFKYKICKTIDEADAEIEANKDSIQAVVLGSQNLFIDNSKTLIEKFSAIPFLSYTKKPVLNGALCGFVADDVKLGKLLAESVADVLVNGKSISQVPVKVDPEPQFYINVKSAEKIGIEIPFNILETATIIEE